MFHGALDDVVPVTESRAIVEALIALDADVRYTEFEQSGHNVWIDAYDVAELHQWMFAQVLASGERSPLVDGQLPGESIPRGMATSEPPAADATASIPADER